MKRQVSPALRRSEARVIVAAVVKVLVVMFTLRETDVQQLERFAFALSGRSPDSQCVGSWRLPGLPVANAKSHTAYSCGGSHGFGP